MSGAKVDLLAAPMIQTHVGTMQGIIQRMAQSSASAKTWCVSVVSAILVLAGRDPAVADVRVAFVPLALFLVLDAYYLALEKGFRRSYEAFVRKAHSDSLSRDDLLLVQMNGSLEELFPAALRSIAVWPFYALLAGMILAIERL
jgi:hypothetical protein